MLLTIFLDSSKEVWISDETLLYISSFDIYSINFSSFLLSSLFILNLFEKFLLILSHIIFITNSFTLILNQLQFLGNSKNLYNIHFCLNLCKQYHFRTTDSMEGNTHLFLNA